MNAPASIPAEPRTIPLENPSQPWHLASMRQILNDIEAGKLSEELRRRGIPADRKVRVVVETADETELPITAINAQGGAFDWLADEPDLYTDSDLIENYRP